MELGLQGKVAWVVGAGGTLGGRIALDLAREGVEVFCSGRDGSKLEALASRIEGETGGRAHVLPVDVTRRDSVDAAAGALIGAAGRLDILVNSVTLPIFGEFLELDDEAWERVMQTKYLGYVRTIRAALPHMLARGEGCVVNVSGKGGRQPRDVHLPGSSANAAVNLLTRGLANVYGRRGVRVVAVSPGVIASPRMDAIRAASAVGKGEAELDRSILGSNALGRLGTPEEVSAGVLFAVSNGAAFCTGGVIDVDGG